MEFHPKNGEEFANFSAEICEKKYRQSLRFSTWGFFLNKYYSVQTFPRIYFISAFVANFLFSSIYFFSIFFLACIYIFLFTNHSILLYHLPYFFAIWRCSRYNKRFSFFRVIPRFVLFYFILRVHAPCFYQRNVWIRNWVGLQINKEKLTFSRFFDVTRARFSDVSFVFIANMILLIIPTIGCIFMNAQSLNFPFFIQHYFIFLKLIILFQLKIRYWIKLNIIYLKNTILCIEMNSSNISTI